MRGAETNTLTDYADALLSTPGEQLERKLQWLLRDCVDELELLLAAALTELAEAKATLVLHSCETEPELVVKLERLLQLTGLCPKLRLSAMGNTRTLAALGARPLVEWPNGKVLLLAPPQMSAENLPQEGRFPGWVCGPALEQGEVLQAAESYALTEVWPMSAEVPRVLHLFPADEPAADAVAAPVATAGVMVRRWAKAELAELISEELSGMYEGEQMSLPDTQTGAALLILYRFGGYVFEGDSLRLAAQLRPLHKATVQADAGVWWFGGERHCTLLEGAFEHWWLARLRGRAVEPSQDREKLEHVSQGQSIRVFLQRWWSLGLRCAGHPVPESFRNPLGVGT